jgi:nucleoside-diphosphate-sugar epimerase
VPNRTPATVRSLGLAAMQQCEWKLPFERAAKQLGYRPTVTFEEGLRRTCAWWRFAQGEFFAAA